MAFKTMNQYNDEKYGDLFTLVNDGDSADVIFLYRNINDVLVADVHYIKSAEYSGYAHCCGSGCPACGYGKNGIRIQPKLFIPLYNITEGKIQFWDRGIRFEPQLKNDVFSSYPCPADYVFTITRHGVARDVNTTYEIRAIARNTALPYDKILADNGVTLPAYYDTICKDLTPAELGKMLNANSAAPTTEYNYIPVPRATGIVETPYVPVQPAVNSAPTFNEPPSDLVDASMADDSSDMLDDVDF